MPEQSASSPPAKAAHPATLAGARDGTTLFASGVTTPLNAQNGVGFLVIARDVSADKHRTDGDRSATGAALESAAMVRRREDLKDEFLAVMSHELKQPLNLIQVSAELLVRLPEVRECQKVQRIGDTIMRAVSAQETIVNDLLDLSRVQTGKLHLRREPVDLTDTVQRLGEALAVDAARKRITLVLDVVPDHPLMCHCDQVRVEQVIWNVLGNAIKFTPEGGEVRVTMAGDQGMARLEVRDTGIGISPEFLPNVSTLQPG